MPESLQSELIRRIAPYRWDPEGFASKAWPWKQEELSRWTGPKDFQRQILRDIGTHLQNPATRHTPLRIAIASGKGVGKSALISIVINWAMSTLPGTRVLITANTATQLETKTQPEVSKWFRLSLTAGWTEVNATSIKVNDAREGTEWRADFIPWSLKSTEAFQGLHNEGKRILLIFDEASAIPDQIWEVCDGALTDENTEIIWLAFGNPTRNSGRFRECFGRFKHRWKTYQIDARKVDGTNKELHAQWVEDYGEDSDYVRKWVRGEFPRAGTNQLIASDVVFACRQFKAEGYQTMPKILSCDVARYGDSQTVIGLRQGRKFSILHKDRGIDTVETAERVIAFMEKETADAVIIDGDGVGGGVVDQVKARAGSANLHEFHGGSRPMDPAQSMNKRAECWLKMREWLKAGAEIPDLAELEQDLTGPEFGHTPKGQIFIEKKEDMRARGLASPDLGDCLAMTFAVNVLPKQQEDVHRYYELELGPFAISRRSDEGWMR